MAEAVEGLAPMLTALRKADTSLYRDLQKDLRDDVGKPFIGDVQKRIREIGLVRSGALEHSFRLSVTPNGISVRSSPPLNPSKKAPQGYAAIYEYRRDKPRPFLNPTMDEWSTTGKTASAFGGVLDRFAENFGR